MPVISPMSKTVSQSVRQVPSVQTVSTSSVIYPEISSNAYTNAVTMIKAMVTLILEKG